jgi:hypothetical protein
MRRAVGPADHSSGILTSTPLVTRFWSMDEWSDLQIGGNGHFSQGTTDVLTGLRRVTLRWPGQSSRARDHPGLSFSPNSP